VRTVDAISETPGAPPIETSPVLYLVGCAAPPVLHIRTAIVLAQSRGYDTCLVLTPTADRWLAAQRTELESLTGHPVRSTYKLPAEPDVLPDADRFVVAPATFNTINKWAAGISDTLALGLLTEAAGRGTQPITVLPYLNAWQAGHSAFQSSVERLRIMGIEVLLGDQHFVPHVPKSGLNRPSSYPWHLAFDAAHQL
jgi:Flavoprotein